MILIVDDRQENVFSLKQVLQQHGFEADSAFSGQEALKKILKHEYALIILDVQMPDMDGFEVAEALNGLNKTKDIPIIFLSAVNTQKKFITKGFESGGVDYLTKPVDPDILILKVRNFFRLYEKTAALKEAEKALKHTIQDLQKTLEALPQLAFTTGRNGDLEYVNEQWLQFAPSKTEFPQTPFGPFQKIWQELIVKGEPITKEIILTSISTGESIYHLLRATPLKTSGVINRWVGTLTSIHEQKTLSEILETRVAERTKELLQANRDLEISNDELQQFTSVASHDLKEPLRKIQFFGNMLLEKTNLNADFQKYLDKMISASRRMSNLIEDLLSFASLSKPTIFQQTDVNSLIREILVDLELTIEEKGAKIKVSPIPILEAVPALIRQLFQNLISNALKFSLADVSPQITIKAEQVDSPDLQSEAVSEGRFCRISIADNGIGFDEVYTEKIFTIFQRLNTASEFEGTGIGLAIAKKIIDRHNGTIFAKSKKGEGATFFLILPIKQSIVTNNSDTSRVSANLIN